MLLALCIIYVFTFEADTTTYRHWGLVCLTCWLCLPVLNVFNCNSKDHLSDVVWNSFTNISVQFFFLKNVIITSLLWSLMPREKK